MVIVMLSMGNADQGQDHRQGHHLQRVLARAPRHGEYDPGQKKIQKL